ncbi:MAG: NAD(P)H-dependent oxidoreductase subunit E [Candidatus Hydrogenedentes bacterium]|nr:NAD(P)H-dependent oxidoreductase subunit E [Candidatus Hydrogenedentota bacterium]
MTIESDIAATDRIIAACGTGRDAVIPILHAVQREFHYLPEAALRRICAMTEITAADLDSVSTFFPQFRRRPAGKHTISVCDGTACHLKGALDVHEAFLDTLGLRPGEDTDAKGEFTLQMVRCLGCCTLAPAVQVDGITYGHVTTESAPRILDDFRAQAGRGLGMPPMRDGRARHRGGEIRIGLGSCCVAGGSGAIREVLEETRARFGLDVHIKHVSCIGMCHQTPILEVVLPGGKKFTYAKVRAEDVPEIVVSHFRPTRLFARLRASVDGWLGRVYANEPERALDRYLLPPGSAAVQDFLGVQRRIATEFSGEASPTDLLEYRARGGFAALERVIRDRTPEAVIDVMDRSGLRGRGGAGFPTGRKWREVRHAPGMPKYIVCNGDEGDPGAFMDRMLLESYTFRVIEGMLIASVAIGAEHGIFYVRAEYPLAVQRVRAALKCCEEHGILGGAVLGSGHVFHAEVREGAGAFVCGEETALIASLEGRRPAPRLRPPFPARAGLHGCPTLVNNVETFSLVPWIIEHGAEAFAAIGTERSSGTKVFALAGKVRRGGLIEVPMGLTVRQIVEEAGGGVQDGHALKAVQIGGPSGGCIPAELAHLPVDYETLASAGSMIGSGGFVVMDETDCMVEMTRYFLSFTQLESCGKCVPCRVGTKLMLEILERCCRGEATAAELAELERLAVSVKKQSLCGLGRTAPNPVLTGLAHFRQEFEEHIAGRCPAHRCKALIRYTITDACIGCTKCAQVCPSDAIKPVPYQAHEIDQGKCIRCDACYRACPVNAVEVA